MPPLQVVKVFDDKGSWSKKAKKEDIEDNGVNFSSVVWQKHHASPCFSHLIERALIGADAVAQRDDRPS